MADKKLIVITADRYIPNESEIIEHILDDGVDFVHIRKPNMDKGQLSGLIKEIDEKYYNRLILHSHFSIVQDYGLFGIHLNRRYSTVPDEYIGHVSCSCHSINELSEKSGSVNYCTLSPIFDSISKHGYHANFSEKELLGAFNDGIINDKVMALGGITPTNIDQLWQYGFGGACVLGYLWNSRNIKELYSRNEILVQKTKQ